MILHATLTDEFGNRKTIKTGVNVQLNPGRGAKVVIPKQKARTGYKVNLVPGNLAENRSSIIKIALSLPINPQMACRNEIDLSEYAENLAIELSNNMNNIHRRDAINFNEWSKKHREILAQKPTNYANNLIKKQDLNGLTNANQTDPNCNQHMNHRYMSLKINIPAELEHILNQADMLSVWNNIQTELQQLATIKLQYWINTRPRCSLDFNGDAAHLAAALDEAHKMNAILRDDNITMAGLLNNYQNSMGNAVKVEFPK